MENNNTPLLPPYELKLEHQIKQQQEAKDFTIDVTTKILKGSSLLQEMFFSSTIDNFIWEDEDCQEKAELYESFVDAGIIELESQFLLNDIILYVCYKIQELDMEYKGVFTLMVEVTIPHEPEPVVLNRYQEPIAMKKTTCVP
ncbi:unnamed protein product [Cochlearia groenlandica]